MALPFASLNLNLIGWLVEELTRLISAFFMFIIEIMTKIFASLIYGIASQLLWLIDFVQSLFRKIAGLDSYWWAGEFQNVNPDGTGAISQDPLIKLITSQQIMEVFIALLIVALAMLIIATIVQIIRVEYTQEGAKNTKGGIIGQSLKSLMLFLIIPIGAVMGIFIANQLLLAIDLATNGQGSSNIAGAIFTASAAEANQVRNVYSEKQWWEDIFGSGNIKIYNEKEVTKTVTTGGVTSTITVKEFDGLKDEFKNALGTYKFEYSGSETDTMHREKVAEIIDRAFAEKWLNQNDPSGGYGATSIGNFDYLNVGAVEIYYNLSKVNYIALFAASIMGIWVLYNLAFGMIIRLYKVTILFAISPPIVAIMPLDGGAAFKQWRQNFLGNVIGAYGPIVALNLFFVVLPILQNIQLFDPTPGSVTYYYNKFVYLLFVVVGCYMVKGLSSMISKIAGGEDAFAAGAEISGKAVGTASKIAMGVATGGASLVNTGINKYKAFKAGLESKGYLAEAEEALEAGDFEKAKNYKMLADYRAEQAGKYNSKANKGTAYGLLNRGLGALGKGTGVNLQGGLSNFESGLGKAYDMFAGHDDPFADEIAEDYRATVGDLNKKPKSLSARIKYAESVEARRKMLESQLDVNKDQADGAVKFKQAEKAYYDALEQGDYSKLTQALEEMKENASAFDGDERMADALEKLVSLQQQALNIQNSNLSNEEKAEKFNDYRTQISQELYGVSQTAQRKIYAYEAIPQISRAITNTTDFNIILDKDGNEVLEDTKAVEKIKKILSDKGLKDVDLKAIAKELKQVENKVIEKIDNDKKEAKNIDKLASTIGKKIPKN